MDRPDPDQPIEQYPRAAEPTMDVTNQADLVEAISTMLRTQITEMEQDPFWHGDQAGVDEFYRELSAPVAEQVVEVVCAAFTAGVSTGRLRLGAVRAPGGRLLVYQCSVCHVIGGHDTACPDRRSSHTTDTLSPVDHGDTDFGVSHPSRDDRLG